MLAARLDGIRFDSVGELELKGFPEPIEAFAVPWTRLADETAGVGGWPVPALLRSVPRTAFVGRDGERARHGALAQSGACGCAAGGAGLRRARDRQEPSGVVLGPWCARRGVCRLVGGVLRGAGGAVRAVDLGVLAAGGARTVGAARAARRAAWRRARATGARAAATVARVPGAGELRSGDRTLPALLGRRRGARGAGGVGARVPRARRSALGGQPVGGAAQARGVVRRVLCAPGDRRLPRLGSGQGSSAERRAGGSAANRGRRADRAARASGRPRCPR